MDPEELRFDVDLGEPGARNLGACDPPPPSDVTWASKSGSWNVNDDEPFGFMVNRVGGCVYGELVDFAVTCAVKELSKLDRRTESRFVLYVVN